MLENEIIKLRALEPADVDKLYIWENNPANWKVSHTLAPYSRHVLLEYINSAGDIYADKQLRLIIETKPAGSAIGTVDLFDCDFKNRRVGIGILLADADSRGKGYGSRTLDLLLPYCFDSLAMHQVYCNVLAENTESLALFEKFGFQKVGLKKAWTVHQGTYYDEWLLQKVIKS
jgi:diamine N-acetyltransferase